MKFEPKFKSFRKLGIKVKEKVGVSKKTEKPIKLRKPEKNQKN
jgi:hypothetical protein